MSERYQEALRRFYARSDYERGTITNPFGKAGAEGPRGLARVRALLAELGDPHRRYSIVHVAGSKGKGSTCAFLSSILTVSGAKTGRYISPHLHSLRERIAIDDQPISEADFAGSLERVLTACELVEAAQPELGIISAFEISTVMAFEHFARMACDLAVIEVGLGGTWDATNVVDPAVAVIALLDYEHTEILGVTLGEIAENKAGIVKPGRPVLSLRQPGEGIAVIRRVAAEHNAPLLVEGDDWQVAGGWKTARITTPFGSIGPVQLGLAGDHQLHNAGLAVMAASILNAQRLATVDREAVETGLRTTFWPARFEVVSNPGEPVVVIDGAHTGASGAALADAVADQFSGKPVELIFGMLGGKDAAAMLAHFRPLTDRVALVRPSNPRAMGFDEMEAEARMAHLTPNRYATLDDAFAAAKERAVAESIIVVTGSLSFAGEARALLGLGVTEKLPS